MFTKFTRKKRERARAVSLVLVAALALTAFVALPAQADLDRTLFELDKDAHDDRITLLAGTLNSAVGASGPADDVSIQVCQIAGEMAVGSTLLIDAERFTVVSNNAAGGGGCQPIDLLGTSTPTAKRNLVVDRDGGSAHAKGEKISRLVSGAEDGIDWDDVFAEAGDNCEDIDGAVACSFKTDGRAESIFTSSKDYDELDQWQWRDQSVPDANELDDAFAIKFVDGTEQHLFFGADRFDTNGSKDAGFWFFQKPVTPVPPVGSADGTFTGEHTPGDVLVLTTFSGGGATVTIRVYEWMGPGGSVAALDEVDVQGDCVPGASDQELCATVNNTTIESPWAYSGKGEPALNQIAAGGFLEGGINLTDLGLDGCFSSYMATTRSSPSLTADPKDFVLDDFESCETEVTTTPADGATPPVALTDGDDADTLPEIQIGAGAAGVDVKDTAVVDVKGITLWDGSLDFYLCGPISTGTCDEGGVKIGSAIDIDETTVQPIASASANLTEVGRYCWRGEFTSETEGVPDASDSSEGECFEVLPVTPTLTTQAVDENGDALTGPVSFGEALYDEATLSGTADQPGTNGGSNPGELDNEYPSINATNGADADGTITFTLRGPLTSPIGDSCDDLATGTGTNPETGVVVTGDDDYMSSGFTPDSPGDFAWQASYSGSTSGNTTGTSHNDDCDVAAEAVTVQQLQPNMDTEQNFVPNDSATVTVASGAGDLAGSVVFALYVGDEAEECGTPAYTSGSIDITDGTGSGTSRTVVSDNTTAYDEDESFAWVVTYTSTNAAHLGVTSGCGNEVSSIIIDNGVTQPVVTP